MSTNKPPKIVWVGFHEEGRFCLDKLISNGFGIEAIITLDQESLAKRSGAIDYSEIGKQHGLPVFKVGHINSEASLKILEEISPDIMFVIGWSQILSEEALAKANMVVGAHASILPKNRGSAPINWSLINGETVTGNTLIELQPGVDTGDILAQRQFEISLVDSCKSLYDKVATSNAEMVLELCTKYSSGNITKVPQNNKCLGVLPRRRPEDGEVDWNRDSKDVYNFIRALTRPYPGAFSTHESTKYIIWAASWFPQVNSSAEEPVGKLIAPIYSFNDINCGVLVACEVGAILISEIEVNGAVLTGTKLIEFFMDVSNEK